MLTNTTSLHDNSDLRIKSEPEVDFVSRSRRERWWLHNERSAARGSGRVRGGGPPRPASRRDLNRVTSRPQDHLCGNCGLSHFGRECTAKGQICRKCGKRGHCARCCRSGANNIDNYDEMQATQGQMQNNVATSSQQPEQSASGNNAILNEPDWTECLSSDSASNSNAVEFDEHYWIPLECRSHSNAVDGPRRLKHIKMKFG